MAESVVRDIPTYAGVTKGKYGSSRSSITYIVSAGRFGQIGCEREQRKKLEGF